jgi:hypothetical protein
MVYKDFTVCSIQREPDMRNFLLIVMFAFTLTACSSTNKATLDGPNKATLNVSTNNNDQGYDSSTYEVPAGADITVNFTNSEPVPLVFAVLKQGEHVTPPFQAKDEDKIMWKLTSQTGETRSDVFKAPTEPGEYSIICACPWYIAENRLTAKLVVVKEK